MVNLQTGFTNQHLFFLLLQILSRVGREVRDFHFNRVLCRCVLQLELARTDFPVAKDREILSVAPEGFLNLLADLNAAVILIGNDTVLTDLV